MEALMNEMNAQMEMVATPVQIWMNWMMVIFLSSIFFSFKHIEARFAFGAFLLTMPIGMLIFHQIRNVHILGIAHFIVWLPLAIYLVKRMKSGAEKYQKWGSFRIWHHLILLTIVISLLFDARDIVLVAMGQK